MTYRLSGRLLNKGLMGAVAALLLLMSLLAPARALALMAVEKAAEKALAPGLGTGLEAAVRTLAGDPSCPLTIRCTQPLPGVPAKKAAFW
mgnify:CR=1 FL=1